MTKSSNVSLVPLTFPKDGLINVNGKMLNLKDAQTAWRESGAKSYERNCGYGWVKGSQDNPPLEIINGVQYRWEST